MKQKSLIIVSSLVAVISMSATFVRYRCDTRANSQRNPDSGPSSSRSGGHVPAGAGQVCDFRKNCGVEDVAIALHRMEDHSQARRLLEAARSDFHNCEFESAFDRLQEARWLDPGDEEVRQLYNEISAILNHRPSVNELGLSRWVFSGGLEVADPTPRIREAVATADALFDAMDFPAAAAAYQSVVAKLKWLPYYSTEIRAIETWARARVSEAGSLCPCLETRTGAGSPGDSR